MFDDFLKKELNFELSCDLKEKLTLWERCFREYNSHTNLMSRGDLDVLDEKHVFDSLAILKWIEFSNQKTFLDVGTGGGFPSVILAICFPEVKIYANDSRIKKIGFIREIKEKLELDNLEIIYSRIEDVEPLAVDVVLNRAVGRLLNIYELSKKHIKKDGYFISYKSKTVDEEITEFKKKYKKAKYEIIPYKLPLNENLTRNLTIFKKCDII